LTGISLNRLKPTDLNYQLRVAGLMLIALQHLFSMITPYEDAPSLRMLLGAVTTDPLIDILLAAGLTWAAHSSVVVVLLVIAFAAQAVARSSASGGVAGRRRA
jgi:phosphate:Na+ symporter